MATSTKKPAKKPAPAAAPDAPQVVGRVTQAERDEIQALFERKNGLLELIRSLAASGGGMLDNPVFYEKVVADLGRTTTKSQQWWDAKSKAYGWPGKPGWRWSIDFDTCRIVLQKE